MVNPKKIDPALKFYHNKSFMINSNARITDNLANGTPCRGMYLKLKESVHFKKDYWDGYMVNTVYANEVDYMICMYEGKKIMTLTSTLRYIQKLYQ